MPMPMRAPTVMPMAMGIGIAMRVPASVLAMVFALVLALVLAGCATPSAPPPAGVQRAFDRLPLAGRVFDVEWHLPAAEPRAWLLLQHGFARRCANLRGTAGALAAQGVAVWCLNADEGEGMAGGAPVLAEAVAAWWRSAAARAPDGRSAPELAVVGGHSAGGLFAARVGAGLIGSASAGASLLQSGQTALGPPAPRYPALPQLAGVLLLDPVGGNELAEALQRIVAAGVPVHATLAPPVRCNAQQLARPALTAAGAQLIEPAGATHVDAEGADSDGLAIRACGEGPPQPTAVAALRRWAAAVLQALLSRAGAPAPLSPP
jgi:hypothetical protein